jgi:DNA polymerase I-like protein with 3'-5' exonuclease and polymerase domains
MVTSWLEEVEDDDRIHGYVNHNGAVTGRMTHRSPNTAQIVSSNSEYGKECRTCWTVPEGKKLVGIDASGLELRMLAHYLDDEEYTNEIINGDIHTHNQRIAGLESRSQGKTFIYALLYGAGDPKLGTVVGGGRDVGARLRKLFFDNLPAFKTLKDRVGRASKKGYIKGLDGRKLIVRSQHAALNTLLQGAGAIVMKRALILFTEYTKHLDANVVANVHDEWQVESATDVAEEVGKMGVKAIKDAGLSFNLACPLDGEYKVGDNWYETH